MYKHSHVVSEIVDQNLCCGCGVCAGVCPVDNLQMHWLGNGDLAPMLLGECPVNCRICLKVCPFGTQSASEDRLAQSRFGAVDGVCHDFEVGYYLETLVGYSLVDGHRERGASGGMATWLLESLLARGDVDAVVCVGKGDSAGQLFEYQVMDEVENIRAAAGTRYYPVAVANALSLILKNEREIRYAVVGLPCVLKGLHLAMEVMPRLRRRIIYTLGLTCGHLPNRFYTDYLANRSGISPKCLATAQYRCKDNTIRSNNFKFRAFANDGRTGQDIPWSKIGNIWADGYFQVNACNYCDDAFAEVADITLMDAWLPEYACDPRGHSLLVVRHPALLPVLREGISTGTCKLVTIPLIRITDSQRGVINNKKGLLGGRLFAAKSRGSLVPTKRCPPNEDTYKDFRRQIEVHFAIQQTSKRLWQKLGSKSPAMFRLYLLLLSLPLIWPRIVSRLQRVQKQPSLLLRLIGRS